MLDPDKTEPGACGCFTADTDTDSDGTPDCQDECAEDPLKVEEGSVDVVSMRSIPTKMAHQTVSMNVVKILLKSMLVSVAVV